MNQNMILELMLVRKNQRASKIEEDKSLIVIKFNARIKSSGALIASLHQLQQLILN